ncbi:MAG: permease [Oceanicoccus sp.]|uniref:permease n=1 Tax=Oceanicoccus sp. TaxID=2691044 RepID=UPI002639BD3D|nr:permease [Oceanicoccus sp.]MDG1772483.1 permease [Oceanicoccus sp.]
MQCHKTRHNSPPDYLLWSSAAVIAILYSQYLWYPHTLPDTVWYQTLALSVFQLINTMWWGIALGIVMVAVLAKIPREFVIALLGTNTGLKGLLRAAGAGVLLDLCSHGILMVAATLYRRGASIGQVMAFLIASPWNSFSLTFILFALIGIGWTLAFIVLSLMIALSVGLVFEQLLAAGKLPQNPNTLVLPPDFKFWRNAKKSLATVVFDISFCRSLVWDGLKESRMILRWIFFGIVLAGLLRALVPPDTFSHYFGPTVAGLGLTVLVATLLEVCSEGSTPIAADLLTRANAPGNSFAFLMSGVATDYTEILVLKETTQSWKMTLLLPVLTVPQVVVVAWLINEVTL